MNQSTMKELLEIKSPKWIPEKVNAVCLVIHDINALPHRYSSFSEKTRQ